MKSEITAGGRPGAMLNDVIGVVSAVRLMTSQPRVGVRPRNPSSRDFQTEPVNALLTASADLHDFFDDRNAKIPKLLHCFSGKHSQETLNLFAGNDQVPRLSGRERLQIPYTQRVGGSFTGDVVSKVYLSSDAVCLLVFISCIRSKPVEC